jgi:putative ABC transport system ATP-binding protein
MPPGDQGGVQPVEREPLVSMRHVWKRYGEGSGQVVALRDASLEIPAGEFVVFLGPSGSGKTTLLNVLGGLDQPSSGAVRVAGYDLDTLDAGGLTRYRRRMVGFVFQFFNLVPTLTARENVELVAGLADDPLDPMEVLAAVGLADRAEHFPAALSGGEQQRVAIARALVKNPAMVLADEPTGNLDFETGVRVLRALQEVCEARAHTVLLVTHNQEIARMAHRIIRLHSGAVDAVGINEHRAAPEELEW